MITQQCAAKLGLDSFDYDGVAEDTKNTEYYTVGVAILYEGHFYTLPDFAKLEQDMDEIIEDVDYFSTICIHEKIDKKLGSDFIECETVLWLYDKNDEEISVYVISQDRETFLYTKNLLDQHIQSVFLN